MTIDMGNIYEEILGEQKDLTDNEKEFAKQVICIREEYAKLAKAEIETVIKKYAEIEAVRIMRLYNRYIKGIE